MLPSLLDRQFSCSSLQNHCCPHIVCQPGYSIAMRALMPTDFIITIEDSDHSTMMNILRQKIKKDSPPDFSLVRIRQCSSASSACMQSSKEFGHPFLKTTYCVMDEKISH